MDYEFVSLMPDGGEVMSDMATVSKIVDWAMDLKQNVVGVSKTFLPDHLYVVREGTKSYTEYLHISFYPISSLSPGAGFDHLSEPAMILVRWKLPKAEGGKRKLLEIVAGAQGYTPEALYKLLSHCAAMRMLQTAP